MLNTMSFLLPDELEEQVAAARTEWTGKIARIWEKDASVWSGEDEAKWLGWLDISERELENAAKYVDLQSDIASAGFSDVLLMGMGGSSLCPEVLAFTFGKDN